ncbi:unnamed protein product [Sordaria macrospora k-hell]|uniref:WGS project CABT00000000 data, contig 2.72 n=2 Tax=Sordaria macrospora TaxID=5147 RepID=F7WB91_SORMK|nr:uncharacterized protein SMAC_09098 [Sordaria macrospora k-hell]CCC14369.1 unnamed protein product [Sordaria macrospora k-hell]
MSVTGDALSSVQSSHDRSTGSDYIDPRKPPPDRQRQRRLNQHHQPSPNTTINPPMGNGVWNIGEVIALSLGVVLVFALCFGFRIWWGRRRDKRRKQEQQQRQDSEQGAAAAGADVEASPGTAAEAPRAGTEGEGRYDHPVVVEMIPMDRKDGGQGQGQGGGDGGGHAGGHAGGHGEGGHSGGGEGGGGSGNGGGGGGN